MVVSISWGEMNSKVQAKKVMSFFRNVSNDHWNVCTVQHRDIIPFCKTDYVVMYNSYCTPKVIIGFEFVIDQQDVLLWLNENRKIEQNVM